MNALQKLLNLPQSEKIAAGLENTPLEIAQQPQAWLDSCEVVKSQSANLRSFLAESLTAKSDVHLVGAGTSHFVGESVRNALATAWRQAIIPVASTEVVVAPQTAIAPQARLMVSFARSGQSPEGNAAVRFTRSLHPHMRHLAVTCNRQGELAGLVGEMGANGYALVLPDVTNDKGLAMTSSYSSMVVAAQALAYLNDLQTYECYCTALAAAGRRVLDNYSDLAAQLAGSGFHRAVYIGNRDLYGVALESHLKMQEMTAGRVLCKAESTLGLRHGPLAALDQDTLVVVYISSDPYVRKYEVDLLRELADRKLGQFRIAVADAATPDIAGYVDYVVELSPAAPLPDQCKAPAAVVFAQMLALFRSINEGLSPDKPSPGGIINRVVQGVTIYPFPVQGE